MEQNPKPSTIALAAEDAEFSNNACEGARENAKKYNLKVVYDRKYPPSTTDFTPIVRAIQAANPDLVIVCSYPLSSVGIVNTVNELNYKPKMIGGAMVGLQATVFKQRLGAKLNGIVNYETWVPSDKLMAPARAFFRQVPVARRRRRRRSRSAIISVAGAYAYLSALGQAIEGAKSIEDDKVRRLLPQEHLQDRSWATGPMDRAASGPSPA
jgi:branched-chain amino acid transport system substrate-binding protein